MDRRTPTTDERIRRIKSDITHVSADIRCLEARVRNVLNGLEALADSLSTEVPENVFTLNPPKDYPPPT